MRAGGVLFGALFGLFAIFRLGTRALRGCARSPRTSARFARAVALAFTPRVATDAVSTTCAKTTRPAHRMKRAMRAVQPMYGELSSRQAFARFRRSQVSEACFRFWQRARPLDGELDRPAISARAFAHGAEARLSS